MKYYKNMQALCDETGINPATLKKNLDDHTELGNKQLANENGGSYEAYPSGKSYDQFGKKFFHNLPTTFEDEYNIAIVTPTIHYCMGGLEITPKGEVESSQGGVIQGLYAARSSRARAGSSRASTLRGRVEPGRDH